VSWADGGGRTTAARVPVRGAERVARYLSWLSRDVPGLAITEAEVNGQPGFVTTVDGEVLLVVVLEIAGGRIRTIRLAVNPDKLRFVAAQPG
jgi:hypothetical protein